MLLANEILKVLMTLKEILSFPRADKTDTTTRFRAMIYKLASGSHRTSVSIIQSIRHRRIRKPHRTAQARYCHSSLRIGAKVFEKGGVRDEK